MKHKMETPNNNMELPVTHTIVEFNPVIPWSVYEDIGKDLENVSNMASLKRFLPHFIASVKEENGTIIKPENYNKYFNALPAQDMYMVLAKVQLDILEVQTIINNTNLKARTQQLKNELANT